jgi:ABC-type multidrug transport system fused ATPase/permease subunit
MMMRTTEAEAERGSRAPGLFRQLNSLFNRRERGQLAILAVALIVRAGVEMIGVGSIAPFMSVVADPSVVQSNEWLRAAYEAFSFTSTTAFLTALGVTVVAVLAVANSFSALALWGMLRFSYGSLHRLSNRMLRGYLAQPYSFFVERNSASFSKTILTEVGQVITGVLTPVLNIAARSLVVLALTGLLIALDPVLAIVIVLVLGGAYGGLYMAVKAKQRRLGRERVVANQERFKVTNEAFGGIKDVKVLGREGAFASRFAPASWTFSKATASNAVLSQIPRYLFETIAFGGIVVIVLYYLQAGEGLAQILPTISLYAFAGYRLMPELQQLFSGVAAIRFNRAALDDLTDDLDRFAPDLVGSERGRLPFTDAVRFDDVTFRYGGANRPALDRVSLSIPRNQTVGLVGASGSGKTTLVDLLLGLYTPESGLILVDETPLTPETLGAWRQQVGYVPQHIFLCDDTIAHNVAFGVPPEAVDRRKVERAVQIAHLHDFIQTLPGGYETVVGERGVRLSGGQRQRIGIARALYHDPEVLVMDEATSALDGATENAVMDAIRELTGQKTIVLIAHRLSTVEDCDCIYLLDGGRVQDQGRYQDLTLSSEAFRAMARLSPSDASVEA